MSEVLHEIQVCTGVKYDYGFENLLENDVADLQTDMDGISALPIDLKDKEKYYLGWHRRVRSSQSTIGNFS